jgi:anti-sigma factor RsiW
VSCQYTQNLLHAYLDGELDLFRHLEVEHHLEECMTCSRAHENHQSLRLSLGGEAVSFKAPAGLRERVQTAIRREARKTSSPRRPPWSRLAVAASVALAFLLGAAAVYYWPISPSQDRLAQDVVSSHVRSLLAYHKFDVESSDQHTVKPWFTGKLEYAPLVKDFGDNGFPLLGGRLDYLDGRPVAALVYKRDQHYINLFMWPDQRNAGPQKATSFSRQGFHLFQWADDEMIYWAVSDLNPTDLGQFVQLVQKVILK